MSRLNNDVVGAQRAVTGTIVDIISNVIALVGTLAIMLSLEWRLTILADRWCCRCSSSRRGASGDILRARGPRAR